MNQMQDSKEVLNSISMEPNPGVNCAEAPALPPMVPPSDATVAKKAFCAEVQRRLSTRSVKPKKFDDEIVEAPILKSRCKRKNTRRQSQAVETPKLELPMHITGDETPQTSANTVQPKSEFPMHITGDEAPQTSANTVQPKSEFPMHITGDEAPQTSASTVQPKLEFPMHITGDEAPQTSASTVQPKLEFPMHITGDEAPQTSASTVQPKSEFPMHITGDEAPQTSASTVQPKSEFPMHITGDEAPQTSASTGQPFAPCNPRIAKPQPNKNRSGCSGLSRNFATLNLGRWKPVDDYLLIENVLQTNDLSTVHIGTIFSSTFTLQEVEARWSALLYSGSVSQTAAEAVRNMHPQMKAAADRHILYSDMEEKELGRFKSTDKPKLKDFQELLLSSNIFHASRTAKGLQKHWLGMKQYLLLPDQDIDPTLSFAEAEELLTLENQSKAPDQAVEKECQLAARGDKRKERLLQGQIAQLSVVVDAVSGANKFPKTWDNNTLAVMRGRLVIFLICAKEVSFGRATPDNEVDMDMSREGPALKMSRRQGTVKLRSDGDFFISNEGMNPFYVNGKVLAHGQRRQLSNNSVVDICGLSFVFLVNLEQIDKLRKQSATTTKQLT